MSTKVMRQIIHIDNEKCNGCGLCVDACHEGAIAIIDGKAQLIRDDYCDGLGNCLPSCPTDALSFEQRETDDYNPIAVVKHLEALGKEIHQDVREQVREYEEQKKILNPIGCKSSIAQSLKPMQEIVATHNLSEFNDTQEANTPRVNSALMQWPVQLKLAPVNAKFFEKTPLLIAADCCAYAYGNFHQDFMRDKVTLIGCPKLDKENYAYKIAEIIEKNNIKDVELVRMEVPCCQGIENMLMDALGMAEDKTGSSIECAVTVLSRTGKIV